MAANVNPDKATIQSVTILPLVLPLVVVVLMTALSVSAGTVQEIYGFQSGSSPSSLIQGIDGAFYGTTSKGGSSGYGSVFKFNTNGTIVTLASFAVTNGSGPGVPLVQGPDGALYGTTVSGGTASKGTIFRVTTNGVLTDLVSFSGIGGAYAGDYPRALALGHDGVLYGTTYYGGTSDQGTVFRITTNGQFTSLVSFFGTDGGLSEGVVQGTDGALYGTASACGPNGYGTVLKCTTTGTLTNLSSFFPSDYSQSCLTELNGAFYGTSRGTAYPYSGVVFQMLPNGQRTVVFSFSGANGSGPCDQMALGNDGALYGTTYGGGSANAGTIFRVTTSGVQTTLASFQATPGSDPEGGLVQGNDGRLYGTAYSGGIAGFGTVFCISPDGVVNSQVSFGGTNGAN